VLVGMMERLDLFREHFKKRFGVRLLIPHANKNPAMEMKSAALANPQIRKKVNQICSLDMELHEKVIDNLNLKNGYFTRN
jgi:hypothetical protein